MSKSKRLARKRRKERRKGRKKFAESLNQNRPKSEIWFEEELKKADIRFPFEKNATFAGYIPDFFNKHYKVIVEVDGSIHELEHIKEKDLKKDKKYKQYGYTVLRVEAYNKNSLEKCFEKLREIRLSKGLF